MRTLHRYTARLLLIITVIHELDTQAITVSNSRTDGSSCVGDSLLTCVANHTTLLSWYVEPDVITKERALQFQSYDSIGLQYYSMTFTATLVHKAQDLSDSRYYDLVSILEVTVTPELNGSRVWCSATGLGNGEVFKDIIMKGPPCSPQGLNYTVHDSDLQNVTLLIQWSIKCDAAVEKFIVSINGTAVNHTVHSNVTKTILIISYNESYTISVKADSCSEESRADVIHLTSINRCTYPRPPENGTIKPYHSLAEGSEISYHCNTGYAPHEEMTAVCTHQGVWSHNPNELECSCDCGTPHPPLNGYVEPYNSTVEGGEVFYQCSEGYSPSDVRMRAVCTAEGVWNPNPTHLLCTVDCGAPVAPNDGSIELYSNRTSVGTVVYYHCNPGFHPEGKKEAVCSDDGVWRPNPTDLTCGGYVMIISAAVAGSILLILCVFLFGSLFLCWRKRHQRTTAVTNEPPPAMVTVSSDPLYEEIPTQVGEESFIIKQNTAYEPRPRNNN